MDEKDLIKSIKSKDEDALIYFINHYGGLMKSVISRILYDFPVLWDEVLNDAIFAVWDNIAYYQSNKSGFKNWCASVARYRAIDALRIECRHKSIDIDDINGVINPDFNDALFLNNVLGYLSEDDKSLFLDIFYDGKSYDEMSKEMGVSKNSLYSRIKRIRNKVRKKLRRISMDNRRIYEKLNAVQTDYEEMDLSEFEIRKLKILAKNYSKKNHLKKLSFIAASVAILLAGILGTNQTIRAEVGSFVQSFFTDEKVSLKESTDLPDIVDEYTISLHKSVTLRHMSFMVEDIILDGDEGHINIIYPKEYSEVYNPSFREIYIISGVIVDGKNYCYSSTGGNPKEIENGLLSEFKSFYLNKSILADEDVTMEICFENFDEPEDKAKIEVTLNSKELNKNNKILLKNYQVPNADGYVIKQLKINPVNPRIDFLEPIENAQRRPFKDLVEVTDIIGKNQSGQIVVFRMDSSKAEDNYLESKFTFVEKGGLSGEKTSDFTLEEISRLDDTFEFQVYGRVFKLNLFGEKKISQGQLYDYREIKIGNPFIVDFIHTN